MMRFVGKFGKILYKKYVDKSISFRYAIYSKTKCQILLVFNDFYTSYASVEKLLLVYSNLYTNLLLQN